ncbi:hypothetical protein [Flammeovirga aprica]|uniref:DUF1444 family protein n=1 Tax=Flammeovirga aprica JL-4 TaxID=694437 RepID=A0A7X9RZF3_9BACT|nr:hypothetical protein [Flammeovirga aprica]NME71583.1 hypothetical protein [Flammeovirga aprica JL-4]
MSFLKRIFGQGTKESDEKVEKSLEQIESGAVTKVYPILKASDWPGIEAGALKQTLFGTQEKPELVLGFGYNTADNFVFLMPKDLEGKDPQKILQDAYQNLEEVQVDFEESKGMLFASGNDFSSEKILCESHMSKAHELLNAEELLVSIPRRTVMMIASKSAPEEIINPFLKMHAYTWQDDSYGNAPIINALFVVKNGTINGLIPME